MKNITVFLLALFIPFIVSAQSLIPYSDMEEKCDICSHSGNLKSGKELPANALLNDYDITFTKIDIETKNNSTYISGYALIEARVEANQLDTFCVELSSDMTVDSILFNGSFVNFTHNKSEIIIGLNTPIQNGDSFSATIFYKGFGNDENGYAGGLHHVNNSSKYNYEPLTYSFTQPFGASVWFPCKQVLSDKIDSLHIFITTDSSYKVSSNGKLTNVVELPENKRRYEWKTKYPIAYYLVAFNVFNYTEYNFYTYPEGFSDSIFIQNFMVDQAHINEMKDEIDKTHDAMNLYCNLFGMYPFKDEKYGHSIWGKGFGMEHQTMTSMPYNIDFRRLSHELSHQWFGNSVTCGSWQDIWLNEGFATYFDYLALKLLVSEQAGKDRMEYYHKRAMTYAGGSVYVPDAEANNASRIFNYKLSYCKAGAVVKMLRFELQDDDMFWQILQNYLADFKNGFATTQDFQAVVNETTGKNYDYFFDQWIYGQGYPTFSGTWYQENDTLTLNVNEQTSLTRVTPLFKMLVQYKLEIKGGGDTLISLQQEQRDQVFRIYMPKTVEDIFIDPNNEVLNKGIKLNYQKPSSVEINELISCNVYPNPFSNQIKISIFEQQSEISIAMYDNRGIKIFYDFSTQMEYAINTSEMQPGLYYIELKSEKGIYRQKILKQ